MKPLFGALALLATSLSASAIELSSPDIKEGHFMANTFEFSGFGCAGGNKSPALQWKDLQVLVGGIG